MYWLYLALAIVLELFATTMMKVSDGFSKILPAIGTFVGYFLCFTFFSMALKKIDLGVAYAIWSAVGITVMATIGIVFYKESISLLKIISLILIVVGVIGLNLSGAHH